MATHYQKTVKSCNKKRTKEEVVRWLDILKEKKITKRELANLLKINYQVLTTTITKYNFGELE